MLWVKKSTFTSPPFKWQYAKKADAANALHTCNSSTSPGTGVEKSLRPTMLTMLIATSATNTRPPAIAAALLVFSSTRP